MNEMVRFYVTSLLVFLAVVLLIEGVYLFLRSLQFEGRSRFARRIQTLSAGGEHGEQVADLTKREQFSQLPWLNQLLTYVPRVHSLDRLLVQSGTNVSLSRFLLGVVVAVLVLTAILMAGVGWLLAPSLLVGLLLGAGLPFLWLVRQVHHRQAQFAEVLPDALDFLARSLRAGNPFSASLRSGGQELPEPVASEFRTTFEEINFGLDLESALHNLGTRVGSHEIRYFVTAVVLQRATGGNLADLLNRLSEIIRARRTTYRQVQINAAEMRLSARVLIALPFLVAGLISLVNPTYMAPLITEPLGRMLLAIQLLLIVIGYLIMRRMVNFHI
ncbi:MAG TPA: type II secretion system F family protein [Gammaproteobacteria bacterium]|nr:type II secretion system F family protein [Gammaproteobacteria bacterium]